MVFSIALKCIVNKQIKNTFDEFFCIVKLLKMIILLLEVENLSSSLREYFLLYVTQLENSNGAMSAITDCVML